MQTIEQIMAAAAKRNALEQGAKSMAAQEHTIAGSVIVPGTGEAEFDIVFPVTFIERPIFTYGITLPGTEVPIPGEFPVATAFLYGWNIEDRPPATRLYKSCRIGIVVNGYVGTKVIVDYVLRGKCLTNPYY